MSFTNEIQDVQARIKDNLEELEEKVENGKTYWNQCNLLTDQLHIRNFIEVQHNEIIHHLNEIKHHLQQITYHGEILESIASNNNSNVQNFQISMPLKYWEKVAEDQSSVKTATVIKRKPKKPNDGDAQVTKVMVKNRVEQYEELQKCKKGLSNTESYPECSRMGQVNSVRCEDQLGDKDDTLCERCYTPRTRSDTAQDNQSKKVEGESEVQVCCSDKKISNTKYQTVEDEPPGEYVHAQENSFKTEPVKAVYSGLENVQNDSGKEVFWNEQYEEKPRIVEMHYKVSSNTEIE